MVESPGPEAQTSAGEAAHDMLTLTSDIVAAYVAHNPLSADRLAQTIAAVHQSLAGLGQTPPGDHAPPRPAVPVRRSVTPEYLVCLEDGRRLKMLKRHLRAAYNLTPDEYRARWGLPASYPMVAPNYAARRSAQAKKIGLGRDKRPLTLRKRPGSAPD
ncbi:MAG: MucR family transcriptional regulator [Alphaproteobacteria bacterium]